ncbi:phage tail family protein [Enterococcus ureilyticus]|uniref:distal tail protein Dit n=1 Tax=Enterococcus ureilyticus TaxID=1131292 RepID=UPI001A92DB57|nr:distal tail protein Dit [Enterococcus ureilyticus]MBO0445548.1 phage tail family protein [Enterococcus ureilyticus]
MISDVVINYGGHILTEKMDLVEVPDFGLLPSVDNTVLNFVHSDGDIFKFNTLSSRLISFKFLLSTSDAYSYRDSLNKILLQRTPQQLKINLFPDRYWYAVIDGDTSFIRDMDQLHETEVNLSFLIPDGVAHAIQEKEYTNQQEVAHACDFKGKISGSLTENPHTIHSEIGDTLKNPDQFTYEIATESYGNASTLDGVAYITQTKIENKIRQVKFSYDLITDIVRRYPGLFESFGATTREQQVIVVKKIVSSVTPVTYGYGSGANGNKLTMQIYNPRSKTWVGNNAHTEATTNKLNLAVDTYYLGDDGFVYTIVYAPPSDGATPSVVNIDYVSLEYTLAFTDNSIKIDNKGTYKTYPIIETTMQSDNGLVAFINSNGALLQFGNPDEVDSVGYQESDWVVNDRLFTQMEVEKAGWKVNDVTFPDKLMGKYTLTPNGTIKYKTAEGVPLATAANWGTSSEYHGVTLSRDISPDSQGHVGAKNFEVRFGLYFITGQLNQTGLALVELRDKNDKQVCSISFVKNASTNNVGTIRLNVRGNVFYEQRYETNMWNIYTNINTEFSIVKHGNEFNFHLGGIKNGGFIKTHYDDTQAETEVTKIVWFGGIFGANSSPMENSIRSVTMQKHNVEKLRNIPNQFGEGDVLRIDPESATVYINGLETYGWALGNDYERFVLEPGENTIRCLVSSWVKQENMPQIKVINREAYL